ncbi:tRNA (adenosine(37)-N6)-threonylcarbamoyltransferase complex dimerization subunit type 1 TsaB [Shimia aestuarii]|uniref:tRNA threonylcarbamoyl adenosine modification protein YeaZ n=1 Tax=Shimia aestuarii TaxID=254406 RepID=A0A1I4HUI1_9RHOB|nr:tRNA (adenosine(37)-N6)-threonylcarbamoyltransferase complex dimerization subunit type 1 TsaB [Shimia aestuarii]SFL45433.1 tRNA threonylcarbamoyl adenosine modification protein YeaZ [Shimia aestuarii]
MTDTPLILAFDTSGPAVAAALLRGPDVLAVVCEDMKRGQAERLMPLLEELLAEAGVTWQALDAIGVGIGPGNFTGIRISVSCARGLALGLGIPAVGVSTFEALSRDHPSPHIAAVPAPRDQFYVVSPDMEAPALLKAPLDTKLPVHMPPPADRLVENIARCAATRHGSDIPRPAPLYIKPADAAPPRDPAPVILE